MIDVLPHAEDFLLAQKCLEGDTVAIRQLQEGYQTPLVNYLVHAGADIAEARMLVSDLWADCLAPRKELKPRLATYSGNAPLQAWLKVVALNSLLRVRRKRSHDEVDIDEEGKDLPSDLPHTTEEPILEITRAALQAAFRECKAEEYLLMHLAHAHGLRGRELAPMFGCSESKISRTLEAARGRIVESTLRHIKEHDPWLEIGWEDIIELCRVLGPSSFGVVE